MAPAPNFVAWWASDFTGATTGWTAEEVGAYVRLLNAQIEHGGIPSDVRRLARIAGMDSAAFEGVWSALLAEKFPPLEDGSGRLANPKMAHERQRATGLSEVSRLNGRKGGRPRSKKPSGIPGGVPGGVPSGKATQTQTQTQTQNQTDPERAGAREVARSAAPDIDPLPETPQVPVSAARAARIVAKNLGVGEFDTSAIAQALLPAASLALRFNPDGSDDSRAVLIAEAAQSFLEGLEREPVGRRTRFALSRIRKSLIPALEIQVLGGGS
jgi:uncharacterized protein YdaU (DUF1376 family)